MNFDEDFIKVKTEPGVDNPGEYIQHNFKLEEDEEDYENLFGSDDEDEKNMTVTESVISKPVFKSTVGSKKLRLALRNIHKKKKKQNNKTQVDVKKQKEKQLFLSRLRRVLEGEKFKINNQYEQLNIFQKSIFDSEYKKTTQNKQTIIMNNVDNDEDENSIFGSFNTQESIEQQIETAKIIGIVSPQLIENILNLQKQLDERQKILSDVFNLTTQYMDRELAKTKKNILNAETINKNNSLFVEDVLRFINHYIIDAQVRQEMYISSRNTQQDLYKQENLDNELNTTLFRNYRNINNSIINKNNDINKEQELKKLINLRQKKKYIVNPNTF